MRANPKLVLCQSRMEYDPDGLAYKDDPPLTGDGSRVAVVTDVPFPKVPEPVDDLPPATVIKSVQQVDGKLVVRGITSDNGTVLRVTVGGKEARATRPNFAEWEAVLADVPPGIFRLAAYAEDAAGNIEQMPHRIVLNVKK